MLIFTEHNVCKILLFRNALSLQMMEDLLSNITFNQDDPALRCIVLCGEGKVFSAGHNLKELVCTCLHILS
jgi:enoyl-CoA hydratase/carnithine racemase